MKILLQKNPSRPGDKHKRKYITILDTGDFTYNAGQWSKHVYNAKLGDSSYIISYQYIVGNEGFYTIFPMMKLHIMQVMVLLLHLYFKNMKQAFMVIKKSLM
jgi:hypothetical protein